MTQSDFALGPDDNLADLGGDVARYNQNIAAIRLVKTIEQESRGATSEEQTVLSRYTGWGSTPVLKQAFPAKFTWQDAHSAPLSAELQDLQLSETEISSMRASSLNAHYTAIPVVRAIWEALLHLGIGKLNAIRMLEPSAGIGHFYSAMPRDLYPKSQRVAVELDTLTASILKALHPQTRVYNSGFECTALPSNYFDLAISNIPFGNYPVNDPQMRDRFVKHSIHDYFFAKAVTLVRPGGIIVFITSRFTLDKKDGRVREWLAERCDLLGSVRLPSTAFLKNGGTEVVTDILFLRKKGSTQFAGVPDWTQVDTMMFKNSYDQPTQVYINQIYITHPEWMLGIPALERGMYSEQDFTLKPDGRDLYQSIVETLLAILPQDAITQVEPASLPTMAVERKSLFEMPGDASPEQRQRIVSLQRIYEGAKGLLCAEIEGAPAEGVARLRQRLNDDYTDHLAQYGCLNHPANVKLIKDNPVLPFLKALEVGYDPLTKTAQPAVLFRRSTVRGQVQAHGWVDMDPIQRAHEALLVSLDHSGKPDLAYIQKLTEDTREGVIRKLHGLIYETPQGTWETAQEYLSGDVLQKLRQAQAAAALDQRFETNVLALKEVQPVPLTSGEVTARMGASWIPEDVIQRFLESIVPGFEGKTNYLPALSTWTIEVDKHDKWRLSSTAMTQTWGTNRRDALEIAEDALNMKQPVIYDQVDDDHRVVNQTATVAAQAKVAEMKEHFARWVWQDVDRTQRLLAIYNETFNCLRARRYNGTHLSLPGLNTDIELRPHQKDAIWRAIQSRSTLLGHVVGAGKTLICICAMMELKRLGLAHKAIVVVPNHLTEQWQKETLHAYPNANVLCAGKDDLSKAKRGEFMSRIATNTWDLIIVPMSSFKLLPVSPKTLRQFIAEELRRLEDTLYEMNESGASKCRASGIKVNSGAAHCEHIPARRNIIGGVNVTDVKVYQQRSLARARVFARSGNAVWCQL
jgi:adenine-specific DNA methylase